MDKTSPSKARTAGSGPWCCAQLLSCVQLFVTPWTVAHQAPLSMGILQAKILEWVAMPSSRGSSQPGIEPKSPKLQVDSLPSEPPEKAWSLVGELRSHMPHGQENQNIKQK